MRANVDIIEKVSKVVKRENLNEAPDTKRQGVGVYALLNGDKIVYVGISSRSIRGRLREHNKKKGWDSFQYCQLKPLFRDHLTLKDLEKIFIKLINPILNKQHKSAKEKH